MASAPDRSSWRVIGAGSALPRIGYGPSGYALRVAGQAGVTLFDCGPGTVRSLAALSIDLLEVRRVVVSHFHADHILDLFALAFARHNPALGTPPRLELVGPRGLARRLDAVAEALGRSVAFEDTSLVEVEPSATPRDLAVEGLQLAYVRTRHTDTSLAWRVELPSGAALTYTGDCCEVPEVADLARGSDLFVAECSFPDGEGTSNHLTPSSAARLARAARVRRLLLSHFYPSMDPREAQDRAAQVFSGVIELARDGSVHAID